MSDTDLMNPYAPPRAQVTDTHDPADGLVLAGRGQRFVAVLLDGIIISLIIWPLYFVFGGASSLFEPGTAANPFSMMSHMFLAMMPGYLIAAAIQGWALHAWGGTLGKKLMGLRIVRADGSRAGFVRLFFLRGGVANVPAFIPLLGSLWALIDMLLIFRESRQCLHDTIADTIVATAASTPGAALAAR
ncbi:MAG TPA: RDD family protein [Burkholderiaceae bacterium]